MSTKFTPAASTATRTRPGPGAGSGTWAVVPVALGVGVAGLSLAYQRGWRSVAWSRAADGLESLATVLALPVALVGAGAVELLRSMAS